MVYLSGAADHKIGNGEMIDHIVELVEKRAEALEAERAAAEAAAAE